jgi:hypothetical protein
MISALVKASVALTQCHPAAPCLIPRSGASPTTSSRQLTPISTGADGAAAGSCAREQAPRTDATWVAHVRVLCPGCVSIELGSWHTIGTHCSSLVPDLIIICALLHHLSRSCYIRFLFVICDFKLPGLFDENEASGSVTRHSDLS